MSIFENTELDVRVSEKDGKILASFTPPADFPAFRGHFPGNPILPGIAQITLVQEILSLAMKKKLELTEIKRVKFLHPVSPGMGLHIQISLLPQGEHLLNTDASVTSNGDGKRIAALKLQFRETA